MPFVPNVSAGQIVASSWGNLVAGQVVMRFTTTAQRSSQLTAPVLNQLTMIDTRPGVVQYWTGTTWADLARQVQAGTTGTITTDGAGRAVVTFPVPFGAVSSVVANPYELNAVIITIQSFSTTTFTLRALLLSTGGAFTGTLNNVFWTAVGTYP